MSKIASDDNLERLHKLRKRESAQPKTVFELHDTEIHQKNTTPQMTCFRGAKVCTKWLQEKVTIKSYSLTTSWNWEQVTS